MFFDYTSCETYANINRPFINNNTNYNSNNVNTDVVVDLIQSMGNNNSDKFMP